MAVVNSFEELISLIKDRLDIVEVISDHVALKKSGANYWGICPFHKDSKPSKELFISSSYLFPMEIGFKAPKTINCSCSFIINLFSISKMEFRLISLYFSIK